jgi:hypothetical protein
MIDVKRIALEICDPEYTSLIEFFYSRWLEFNDIAFQKDFQEFDTPLIIIEPLTPIDQEAINMGASVGGTFWFSEYKNGQVLTKHIEFDEEKGLEWDPYAEFIPTYWLDEKTMNGDDVILKSEDRYKSGRLLFMEDVILHEMVHHDVYRRKGPWEYLKRSDAQKKLEADADQVPRSRTRDLSHFLMWINVRKEHSMFFRDSCNLVAPRLGLREVEFYARLEDHIASLDNCCSGFPHNVRPKEYYLEAKMWV